MSLCLLICFALFAPPLASISLMFGPTEYFWLALLGLTLISTLSEGDNIKSLIGACIGLLMSMIGVAVVGGDVRMIYKNMKLMSLPQCLQPSNLQEFRRVPGKKRVGPGGSGRRPRGDWMHEEALRADAILPAGAPARTRGDVHDALQLRPRQEDERVLAAELEHLRGPRRWPPTSEGSFSAGWTPR